MFWTVCFTVCAVCALLTAWLRPALWRFVSRVFLLYLALLLASVSSCVGSLFTYFANEGCVFAFSAFNFFCSFWLDVTVEVCGAERIERASGGTEQNPLVIISNHQSTLDLYVLSMFWPSKCTVMMKKSLQYVPFFNIGATLSNCIFVDRFNRENAKQALDKSVDTMRQKKLKVWIFPEGTRNRSGHGLLPFKKGAFNVAVRAHFPIVPVVISDYSPFYSARGKYFHTGGHVIVQVMEPISTENLEHDDVPKLCDEVAAKMAKVYEAISAEVRTAAKETAH
ncbi:hypothetical protein niasHS_018087 [Heterodera schachtii]|uniref:1-acyl-sn-glycerol-3-phosphate acyltransferase n=1 Tax=Heterodera schachtii TaxID=97005 RepID=A0ABD2HV60_HETSC